MKKLLAGLFVSLIVLTGCSSNIPYDTTNTSSDPYVVPQNEGASDTSIHNSGIDSTNSDLMDRY